jgi:hypothetical protein
MTKLIPLLSRPSSARIGFFPLHPRAGVPDFRHLPYFAIAQPEPAIRARSVSPASEIGPNWCRNGTARNEVRRGVPARFSQGLSIYSQGLWT